MQKSLTPKQRLEHEKLDLASKQAESAMLKAELVFGKASPQYAVAERLKDEILAKMQRLTGALDGAERDQKPATSRVVTQVVRARRIIRR